MTDNLPTPPYAHRVPIFAVPRKIISGDLLRILTGEALAMYLLIAFKIYRRRTPEFMISDFEMQMALDMSKSMVRATRTELRARDLIEFKLTSAGALYRFPDCEPPTPAPALTV